jgi:hypothetical protein
MQIESMSVMLDLSSQVVIARPQRGRSNPESQRKTGLLRSKAPHNDDSEKEIQHKVQFLFLYRIALPFLHSMSK